MNRFFNQFRKYRYSFLFFSIVVLLFMWPFLQPAYPFLTPFFFLLLLLGIISTLDMRRVYLLLTALCGLGAFLLQVADITTTSGPLIFMSLALYIIFLSIAIKTLIGRIFHEKIVTWETIKGGMAVYFLIGFLWGFIYIAIGIHDPGAISFPNESPIPAEVFYFSFVTLTTLGYGDITPVSMMARNLTIIEATIGQIYLTVLVARLVGLHLSGERLIQK